MLLKIFTFIVSSAAKSLEKAMAYNMLNCMNGNIPQNDGGIAAEAPICSHGIAYKITPGNEIIRHWEISI
jgi:hypothetical protein